MPIAPLGMIWDPWLIVTWVGSDFYNSGTATGVFPLKSVQQNSTMDSRSKSSTNTARLTGKDMRLCSGRLMGSLREGGFNPDAGM